MDVSLKISLYFGHSGNSVSSTACKLCSEIKDEKL